MNFYDFDSIGMVSHLEPLKFQSLNDSVVTGMGFFDSLKQFGKFIWPFVKVPFMKVAKLGIGKLATFVDEKTDKFAKQLKKSVDPKFHDTIDRAHDLIDSGARKMAEFSVDKLTETIDKSVAGGKIKTRNKKRIRKKPPTIRSKLKI